MRIHEVFDLVVHRHIICVTCKSRGSGLLTHSMVKFGYCGKATKFENISHITLKLLSNVKIKWEIFSNFCGLLKICELYAIRERMLEKQKKCPKGKVSLHLNRKLFRRLPLDFHGKITLIDSPSTSVLVRYTQYPIMYIRTDLSNDPFITWIWIFELSNFQICQLSFRWKIRFKSMLWTDLLKNENSSLVACQYYYIF